jgi:hypothetical protein
VSTGSSPDDSWRSDPRVTAASTGFGYVLVTSVAELMFEGYRIYCRWRIADVRMVLSRDPAPGRTYAGILATVRSGACSVIDGA